jgi:hypothetical protein
LRRQRKVFVTKKTVVTGGWTHLHVAVILDMGSCPNIIQVVTLRRLRYVWDLESTGYGKMHTGLWWVLGRENISLGNLQ